VSVREGARASAATIDLYYFEKAFGTNAPIIAELSSSEQRLASSTTWRDSWEALALPPALPRVAARAMRRLARPIFDGDRDGRIIAEGDRLYRIVAS
jgi:hypothetical protein